MGQEPMLHLLCGKLASGKSTLSRRLAEAHGAVLISEDLWLSTLYPEEIRDLQDYLKYAARLKAVMARHAVTLLHSGLSVVLDFPGNTPDMRQWGRGIFEAAGVDHLLHYLEASDDLCKRQMHQRNEERPEGSVFVSEETFDVITSYFQPPRPEEGFNLKVYKPS